MPRPVIALSPRIKHHGGLKTTIKTLINPCLN